MVVLPLLIFLSVSCGIAGLVLWLVPGKTQQRLQRLAPRTGKSEWIETVAGIVGPFARLSAPEKDWETSPLKTRFLNAGIRHRHAQAIYFGAKTLLPVVFAGLMYLAVRTSPQLGGLLLAFVLLLAALAGCYLPNLILALMVRHRKRDIFESFPDAADLMLVCVEAGLGLDAGLTKVAEEIRLKSLALAEELHLTNLEMRAGGTRDKSLRNLALRTGVEEIGTFAVMLAQADKLGTSIGDSLRVFSDELRHKRQVRAEEMAATVSTKMLFPLVTCIFPAIIMVILGPAAIQIIRTVLPMIGGMQ
jgi:tight adherence protein C